jgi:hypothetical protein
MAALSSPAAEALARATADGTSVRLAPGQLDRKVYVEVDQALSRIGGQWNRKAKAHLFPHDPRPALAELIDAGQMPDDRDKLASFWRTPVELADRMARRCTDLPAGSRVLEPSAGDGALARAIHRANPGLAITAVEPDPARAESLGPLASHVYCGRLQDFAQRGEQFDAVVMNPPFTEPGDPTAWAEHIEIAWSLLRAGGSLTAIAPASLAYRQHRRINPLRERIAGRWQWLPDDAFKVSGTGVRTVLVEVEA